MKTKIILSLSVMFCVFLANCNTINPLPLRTYSTSFETVSEFTDPGFYIVPQNYMGTSSHDLSTDRAVTGTYSHKAWVYGANADSTTVNNNHRGYPTIQLHKLPEGGFRTPCYITLWVWLNMPLTTHSPENQWFSFATLTPDSSDAWSRTVCVNLSYDGFVHLMHVPNQGEQTRIFQTNTLTFPQSQWVQLKIYIDFSTSNGYCKVWQDGVLVSHALVNGGDGYLQQAHFGLYCAPSISSGTIYNDDLVIEEVSGE